MRQLERSSIEHEFSEAELEKKIYDVLRKEPSKSWTLEELFPFIGINSDSKLGRTVVWHLILAQRAQITVDSKLQACGV